MGYFTNVEEVRRMLSGELRVVFKRAGEMSAAGTLWWSKDKPEVTIRVNTEDSSATRKFAPWSTSHLEEQQVTLLHELCHLEDRVHGRVGHAATLLRWHNPEEEAAIDIHAYKLLQETPLVVDEVVYCLMAKGASFTYEAETPFLEYHRKLIRDYFRAASSPALLCAPRQSVMLKYAAELGLDLEKEVAWKSPKSRSWLLKPHPEQSTTP